MSEEEQAPERRWGMGDALLGILASLVLSLVGVSVALGITGDDTTDDLPLWATALLQIPLWVGLFGVAWLAVRRKGTGSLRDDLGLWMQPRDVPIGIAAGVGAQIAIGLLAVSLYDLLGIDTDKLGEAAEELADRAIGGVDIVLLVLIVVIGAPIVEEVFYRGLWLRSIEKRTRSRALAVIGSSVIFGAAHFQPYDFVALAPAGMVFGWLAVRAGRLGPAIWAHVGFNLLAVVSLLAS